MSRSIDGLYFNLMKTLDNFFAAEITYFGYSL